MQDEDSVTSWNVSLEVLGEMSLLLKGESFVVLQCSSAPASGSQAPSLMNPLYIDETIRSQPAKETLALLQLARPWTFYLGARDQHCLSARDFGREVCKVYRSAFGQ